MTPHPASTPSSIAIPSNAADWSVGDFEDLEQSESGKRAVPALAWGCAHTPLCVTRDAITRALGKGAVQQVVRVRAPNATGASEIAALVSIVVNTDYRRLNHEHSMFKVGGVGAEDAQRYPALLEWVYSQQAAYAEVNLLPPPYTQLLPKRWYRHSFLIHRVPMMMLDHERRGRGRAGLTQTRRIPASVSIFEFLPVEPIYTLDLDKPLSWVHSGIDAVPFMKKLGMYGADVLISSGSATSPPVTSVVLNTKGSP
ncbi:hypothetical protein PENSPDRAFT_695470 [Peniophora sp. CONT]|nr:hypothetical protein PENSPDRAFT_695470 [Peniophora sp. CONT]